MKSTSKKEIRIFSFISLVFVMLFAISNQAFAQTKHKGTPWPVPEEFAKLKNPITIGATTLDEGKELYNQHCKSCHGLKGKGDGPKADKIDIFCGDFSSVEFSKATEGEAYWKTTEGRKPMPSFKEKLTENERWTVIYYIRTLKSK